MYPFRGASARTCLGVRALLLAVAAGCRRVDATATPLALAGLAVLAAPAASLRVACLGDSITRGDTKHEPKKEQDKDKFERGNWPRYVSQDSDEVEAKNFGQSGVMVLRGKKQYTDTDIYQEVVAWAPDVAIIWLGINGTNTDGRRGSATYWRDRAAATEKPSRSRDQGRKVSPVRDQSGKPAKRDRRRREAGIFTL